MSVKLVGGMKHRCPNCKKVIDRALGEQSREEKFYPFCSERCKLVDLGRWIDGDYKIITELKPENEERKTEDGGQNRTPNIEHSTSNAERRGQKTDDGRRENENSGQSQKDDR